jgi:hypothetical protein
MVLQARECCIAADAGSRRGDILCGVFSALETGASAEIARIRAISLI